MPADSRAALRVPSRKRRLLSVLCCSSANLRSSLLVMIPLSLLRIVLLANNYVFGKVHKQGCSKLFLRSNSDFLIDDHSSAIPESPNLTASRNSNSKKHLLDWHI